jgi:peptidyl-dipeptidase Dcp
MSGELLMRSRLMVAWLLGATIIGGMTMASEAQAQTAPAAQPLPQATGPFAQPSTLPFHAPDFTKITDADFKPALEQGMAIQKAEVEVIANNPAPPTFENTIVALEKTGRMLGRVEAVFGALTSADTNDVRDRIDAEESPRLTAHYDSINLNPKLFARVKAVYDQRAALNLDEEDARLLEKTYKDMAHAGALLSPDQQAQVVAINGKLAELTTQFGQVLTQAQKDGALVIDDKAKLAGMSEPEIAAAAKEAADRGMPGKWVLALQNTTQQPQLLSLTDRATREALFNRGWHRADKGDKDDTGSIVAQIVNLRAQKAALFGEPDWATHTLYDSMAKNPKIAVDFLKAMVPPLGAAQRAEAAELNGVIKADGKDFTVRPWDWQLYAAKFKTQKYDFNEDTLKPYFEIHKVLEDGVFYAANQLYGLTFKRRTDIPVYNPDVWTYTVYDKDGSELGLYYFDPYQRPNKQGGAWMSNFVEQSKVWGTKPVVFNVLNIQKAPAGQPQLVTWDNVTTMFHEFGHALHGLFANQKYTTTSGTNVARDFVEYPSQTNEQWASDPKVLAHYAKHYQTGAALDPKLVDKLLASQTFDQGYQFGETVEAALLDMQWHALSPQQAAQVKTTADVDAMEAKWMADLGLDVDDVPPRYRSTYFRHIFGGSLGYSAGYYAYLWTQMLDHDSRHWFQSHGGLTRANGQHFRDTVLSKGGTEDYNVMFRNFTGHDPSPLPLLEDRGLAPAPGKPGERG